jgi:UDP-N-acetylglucosamine--N-acetylmuramyl-(pentapeptide) pyrophosphoryl-undecaprenol N-acetylglucosamine transferase
MRVLFVGGGSIGHIAPCVAVWRALHARRSDAKALFACSTRPADKKFLDEEQLEAVVICPRRVNIVNFPIAFVRSVLVLRKFQPNVVFSKGGAVSVPTTLAAAVLRIPVVAHESDAVSGKATSLISKFATVLCHGFPRKSGQPGTAMFTGNPVRPEVREGSRERGMVLTNVGKDRPVLLVLGGSQGATALNDAITHKLDELLRVVDVVHLTGEGKSGAGERPRGYWSREFAHADLPHLYALCTLALSRAGAGALSELSANAIPTILVPLRGLAQDHQSANATVAAMCGGCVVIEQEQLERELVPVVTRIVSSQEQVRRMEEGMRSLARDDAAEALAAILERVAANSRTR